MNGVAGLNRRNLRNGQRGLWRNRSLVFDWHHHKNVVALKRRKLLVRDFDNARLTREAKACAATLRSDLAPYADAHHATALSARNQSA